MDGENKTFDFEGMDPSSGFKIVRDSRGGDVALYLAAVADCEFVNVLGLSDSDSVELVAFADATPVELGAVTRLEHCLDAVARYMTTGGSWDELAHVLERMRKVIPAGGLAFPGWHYLDGGPCDLDNRFQHVFVSDEDQGPFTRAVVWVEELFVEPKTLAKIREEQRDNEERGQDAAGDETGGGGACAAGPGGALLELSYRENPGEEE